MVASGVQIAGSCVRPVSHLYLNSYCCIGGHICIVGNINRLASLAAMTMLVTGGFGVAHETMRDAHARSIEAEAAKGSIRGGCVIRAV
jgi:hypothetical protein